MAAAVAVLNALLPPLVAALRLPYTVGLGFVLVLLLDAWMLMAVERIDPSAVQIRLVRRGAAGVAAGGGGLDGAVDGGRRQRRRPLLAVR